MAVSASEWTRLLRADYLDQYVREGGAAVKFVMTGDPVAGTRLLHQVAREGEGADFLVAHVDAARVRVHMMQDVFFAIAERTPWERLAARAVSRFYTECGVQARDGDLRIEAVAEANGLDPSVLNAQMRQQIEQFLQRGDALSKDFRLAVLWLCLAQTGGGGISNTEDIISWLEGRLRLVSALKRYLIFRKIGRHNARAMLTSLGAWLQMLELSGLVVTIDIRQLSIAKRAAVAPDDRYYTKAALFDAYEVLRQLIDSTDDLRGVLAVVLADESLIDDERRGARIYKALYERIVSDVRVRERDNPMSALARLGDGPAA